MFAFLLEEKNVHLQNNTLAMPLSGDTRCLVNILQAKMVRITSHGFKNFFYSFLMNKIKADALIINLGTNISNLV